MKGPRALVVDDEMGILILLQTFLQSFGYDVWLAQSGTEALDIIGSGMRFAVVISDVQMPGMTGWQLYERALGIDTDLQDRFIFATGNCSCQEAEPILDAGKRLLEKPFSLEAVRTAVNAVFNGQ